MEAQVTSTETKEIVWEMNVIRIPFDTTNERDRQLYGWIRSLQNQVDKLQKEQSNFEFLSLNKEQAKEKIIDYLKNKKLEGHGKIELFELSHFLRLPAIQVEEILEELDKDGLVTEI